MQGGGAGGPGGGGGGQPPGGQQFDPASCKSLYVGNLHAYVTETMLQEVFAQIGPLVEVKIIKDKVTGMSAGYGFVKFYDHPVAEAALSAVNGKLLYGQEVRVNWAFQKDQREDTTQHFHIFVGDLAPEINDRTLFEIFSQNCPGCSDARVMWDHNTGRSKGYGFVSFRQHEEAENAITAMNGEFVGSRRVRCGWAQHKQEIAEVDADTVDKADPTNANIYVGNLASDVTETHLRELFVQFGPIVEVKVYRKGSYGFVSFQEHQSAVDAILRTNGTVDPVNGRLLKVSWGRHSRTAPHAAPGGMQGLPMGGYGAYQPAQVQQAPGYYQPPMYQQVQPGPFIPQRPAMALQLQPPQGLQQQPFSQLSHMTVPNPPQQGPGLHPQMGQQHPGHHQLQQGQMPQNQQLHPMGPQMGAYGAQQNQNQAGAYLPGQQQGQQGQTGNEMYYPNQMYYPPQGGPHGPPGPHGPHGQ